MHVVVAGRGIAGCASALLLARAGCEVTIVDRDDAPPEVGDARPGCPQAAQGHAFLARGTLILRELLPKVLEALGRAGANPIDANPMLPGELHDPELIGLGVRRALIDAALAEAIARAPIEIATATVTGLIADGERESLPVVRGVRTTAGDLPADLVVDALGRATRVPRFLQELGGPAPIEERHPIGNIYFGRPFRIRDEAPMPPATTPVVAAGSLGYLFYAAFLQDERVIMPTLVPQTTDEELRALGRNDAWLAAARAIPAFAPLVDEANAEPIGPVRMLGGQHNTYRTWVRDGRPVAHGLVPAGDTWTHTNPRHAYGMSMALVHAATLASLVTEGARDLLPRLHAALHDELWDRFRFAVRSDAEAARIASGAAFDPTPGGDRAMVIDLGVPLLARQEPALLHRMLRRGFGLDPPSAIDGDEELVARASEAVIAAGVGPVQPAPTREALLAAIGTA